MTFEPRTDILPEAPKLLWGELRPLRTRGMVLYGGTAIALRLGHRISIDFDFFSSGPLDKEYLYQTIPSLKTATTIQNEPDSFTVLASPDPQMQPVKLSFFGSLKCGRVEKPTLTSDFTAAVASFSDLLAHKLKVLLQRVEAKDYQDIAALLRAKRSLAKGLSDAVALFGPTFQPSECLRALTYFEGGDLHRLTPEDKAFLIREAATIRTVEQAPLSMPVLFSLDTVLETDQGLRALQNEQFGQWNPAEGIDEGLASRLAEELSPHALAALIERTDAETAREDRRERLETLQNGKALLLNELDRRGISIEAARGLISP